MESILKKKSVGSGMVNLLNKFCMENNIPSPVTHIYDVSENIPFERWLNKISYIDKKYGREGLGLEIAKYVNSSHIGVCAYIAENSETLGDYLNFFTKYTKIWYNYTDKSILSINNNIVISWDLATYYSAGFYIKETIISEELQVAIIYQRISQLLDIKNHIFIKLELSIPQPKNPSIYERYFKCPIAYNMSHTRIYISKDLLEIKNKNADHMLFIILIQYADKILEDMPDGSDFIRLVKIAILKSILNNEATIDTVAENLNLSIRNLQKILKNKNITFQELLKDTRFYLSKKYLLDDEMSVLQIAQSLGYKEQTSFIRAFKLWTGESPNQWKNSHKNISNI